ncbi:hypothetical protein RND71_037013 [Anisodus tanguticus]|uniref:Uncharacterized protein n=1 Tax=Anisodus tanguticus TaxID=243964 RepID=A0AAE1R1I8_9SOLA|nr:hypothetical protein RND71_037013 [Anisodus tanguticus]
MADRPTNTFFAEKRRYVGSSPKKLPSLRQTIPGDSSLGPSPLLPVSHGMCLNDQGLRTDKLISPTRSYPRREQISPTRVQTHTAGLQLDFKFPLLCHPAMPRGTLGNINKMRQIIHYFFYPLMRAKHKKILSINPSIFTPTDINNNCNSPKSTKSPNKFFEDPNDVVGLGIVAAMSSNNNHQSSINKASILVILPKSPTNPIPIMSNIPKKNKQPTIE